MITQEQQIAWRTYAAAAITGMYTSERGNINHAIYDAIEIATCMLIEEERILEHVVSELQHRIERAKRDSNDPISERARLTELTELLAAFEEK